jgi:hypothetical protein
MSTWVYDDGGRADAGYRGLADDCVTRAIAIATGTEYALIYVASHDADRFGVSRAPPG